MNEQEMAAAIAETGLPTEHSAAIAWGDILDSLVLGESLESAQLDYAIAHGYLHAFLREIHREPIRPTALLLAVKATTWICLSKKHAKYVAEYPGFLNCLSEGAKRWIPNELGRHCLACFKNISLQEEARTCCLDAGGLDLALSNLHYLDEGDQYKVIAIGAAQLICRLVGKEETGPGPEAIKSNPKIIEALLWILTSILDAGPGTSVLGINWYPIGTVTDVASLCSSDRNKPLLGLFVPQIIRMLRVRNENPRAVARAVYGLSQLYFEPKCRVYFDMQRTLLIDILTNLIQHSRPKSDDETKKLASFLLANLLAEPSKSRHNTKKIEPGRGCLPSFC